MKKRQFLTNTLGLLAGAVSSSASLAENSSKTQPKTQTILTIVGDIKHSNRGKLDPVRDQFMYKHGVKFDKGYTFALQDLEQFSAKTIQPTMEYDARVHKLSGSRLMDVLNHVGIEEKSSKTSLILRGIDGYSPEVQLSDAQKYDFILATQMDNELLAIGGLGPLFAIYDADRIAEFAKKPLNQRFVACPWGLYCIEVHA